MSDVRNYRYGHLRQSLTTVVRFSRFLGQLTRYFVRMRGLVGVWSVKLRPG